LRSASASSASKTLAAEPIDVVAREHEHQRAVDLDGIAWLELLDRDRAGAAALQHVDDALAAGARALRRRDAEKRRAERHDRSIEDDDRVLREGRRVPPDLGGLRLRRGRFERRRDARPHRRRRPH
jgi:hypothetical protein